MTLLYWEGDLAGAFASIKEALRDIRGIEVMPEARYGKSNRWLTVILIGQDEFGADPETVRRALEAEDIESRPVWKPMHLQPVFKGCEYIGGEVAEDLFKRGLCLPSGTAMTEKDLDRVVSTIAQCRRPK